MVRSSTKCVEKAEALMQKMNDLGFPKKTKHYNFMLNLYYKTGNMEKLEALLLEMEKNDIVPNAFALGIQLSVYAAIIDIEKMNKIVSLMDSDPNVVLHCINYTAAATVYIKAGIFDKALEMLKKAEAHVTSNGFIVYNHLLTQYANIGRKDEVLRVWSLYKNKYKVYNKGYECFLKSLVKLGDLEMAERFFDEWESQDLSYDINIVNIIICAYSSKGMFEKAEALIERVISKGGKPNAWTWYHLATGYLEKDQHEKAVEMMKRAVVLCEPLWKPSSETLALYLEHLKGVGDIEQAEEFIKSLLQKSIIPLDIQEKLLNAFKSDQSVQNGALLEFMEAEEKIENKSDMFIHFDH